MAKMIPSTPREFDPRSKEGLLFYALNKLPDEYVVIHSCTFVSIEDQKLRQNEGDFVVFHKDLGILCIESKAGAVSYANGNWLRSDGTVMGHDGPFRQAQTIACHVVSHFGSAHCSDLLYRCKVISAVWFPSLSRHDIEFQAFPPEASKDLVLSRDDLNDLNGDTPAARERVIRRLFKPQVAGTKTTRLSDDDARRILEEVLCPEFNLTPTGRFEYDFADMSFARLLESQEQVLNFIGHQRFAVIEGAAGTGKTLIAIERAKRAAATGKDVLYLCYNKLLKDDIAKRLTEYANITVQTVDGFAYEYYAKRKDPFDQYSIFVQKLEQAFNRGTFPYSHIVVDEGQDFGTPSMEQAGLLPTLRDIILMSESGTFYLFYDKRQLVQSQNLPHFIEEAGCKLTLYANCRNSRRIAECSMRGLENKEDCEVMEGVDVGHTPQMLISEYIDTQRMFINKRIRELKSRHISDIVILTCSTLSQTALKPYLVGGKDEKVWLDSGVRFTTCRRFKGLEAEAVILVDVNQSLWGTSHNDFDAGHGSLYYAGASRAKYELIIVCNMDEQDCKEALSRLDVECGKKPMEEFAAHFKTELVHN